MTLILNIHIKNTRVIITARVQKDTLKRFCLEKTLLEAEIFCRYSKLKTLRNFLSMPFSF